MARSDRPARGTDRSTPSPPSGAALLGEVRVASDVLGMVIALAASRLKPQADPRGLHVILVPGFSSDERPLKPLERYLNGRGFLAEGWGLGRNLAGVDIPHEPGDVPDRWDFQWREPYRGEAAVVLLAERLIERVQQRRAEVGLPIALVGWSLGGYLAREAARELPETVTQVVTLGTPARGGPKYTVASRFFRQRGMDLDWIEEEVARREARPIRQPITNIYSKSDGIVDWRACIDHHSPDVRHIEVNAAHLGMGFNTRIWQLIVEALEASSGEAT